MYSDINYEKEKKDTKLNYKVKRRKSARFRQNLPLFIMFLPIIIYYVVFKFAPMFGIAMAFQDYNMHDGILHSPWAGLKYMKLIFTMPQTIDVIKNTFRLGILKMLVDFPFPIILALLLNEVRKLWFKRTVQTLVYLPHFLSWVIVGGMAVTIFSQQSGALNAFITKIAGQPYPFLYKPVSWITIFLGSGVWKEVGFSAIIYIAALSGIDPCLYESAAIDGANKFRQIWNITLPGIRTTIILMFILASGHIAEVGFDQVFMLQNAAVNNVADVISTYVFRVGLQGGQFSLTAAIGLFQSGLSLLLVYTTNKVARKYGEGLW